MKKYSQLLLLAFVLIFSNCETETVIPIIDDSISFQLFNYSDRSYQSGELIVGAINSDGDFIPTETRDYVYVPSNLSPTGAYTNLDNCTLGCGSDGLIDGYHYFASQGDIFVQIPFSPEDDEWDPDLNAVLEISDTLGVMFKLPDGYEEMIGELDIRRIFIEYEAPVNVIMTTFIQQDGIEGRISF